VLTTGTDTFLRIGQTTAGRGSFTEEIRYKLVHPCIGEQQVGRSWHQAGAGNYFVAFTVEEIEETLAYFS